MSYFTYNDQGIYYQVTGRGEPLLLAHGNAASGKMFAPILSLYKKEFQVITIDFLGYGRSARVDSQPLNLWQFWGEQIVALIEHLELEQVNLVGTSGGAYAVINAALNRPDLVRTVTADSFDGGNIHPGLLTELKADREKTAHSFLGRLIYRYYQGRDWPEVVTMDTAAIESFMQNGGELYSGPLSAVSRPLLFIGSERDQLLRRDLAAEYQRLTQEVPDTTVEMFEKGAHPAILSNAEASARAIKSFVAANR